MSAVIEGEVGPVAWRVGGGTRSEDDDTDEGELAGLPEPVPFLCALVELCEEQLLGWPTTPGGRA